MVSGASPQLAKTVGLVLAAILLGVVMLNLVDDGGSSSTAKSTTTVKPVATTTTAGNGSSSTTLPVAGKKPAELRVVVLNGSGTSGVARRVATALRTAGYVNQQAAGTLGTQQVGSTVHCKSGLDAESAALVAAVVKLEGPNVKAAVWPTTPPKMSAGSVGADVECIVIVGRTA
jgi:hypothetical protein